MWYYVETNQNPDFTDTQKESNATEIYRQLSVYGWTLEAISGLLGNFEWESWLNPGQWQLGYPIGGNSGGLGLGQWTPPDWWRDYATDFGHPLYDGHAQMDYVNLNNLYRDGEFKGEHWNTTKNPKWTWNEYKTSTETPETCAEAFFNQWEQANDSTLPDRQELARKWYDFLGGVTPGGGKIPLWLLWKWTKNTEMER